MKRAIIYTRVSTDEQANSGYSLGVQYDQLVRYCEQNNIEVVQHFVDDHSAKSFNRPQFNQLLQLAKAKYKSIDYLLFVSWDRFSRNAPEAYEMLERFKKYNIEVQAIMQPIDFSVPQNKIMLAIYLALPEVDNDIRSQKIKAGIRGAKKLGRWTSNAPIGYKNSRDELNKPIIVVNPEKAKIIRWVFEEIALGERAPNIIRMELPKKGVTVSKSSFYYLLRNPLYIGKMLVGATENEPQQIVDAIHEAIISEELFHSVQMLLDAKNKRINKHHSFCDRDELPLRGILSCSNCGKHVTGSASKSRNGTRHFYYHCLHCSKERYIADIVNEEMELYLSTIQIDEAVEVLYRIILVKEVQENASNSETKRVALTQELNKLEQRKKALQNLMLDGELNAHDYTELKSELDSRILEIKVNISDNKAKDSNFKEEIQKAVLMIPNLVERYRNSSVQEKQEIIGSIFPQKFVFKNNEVGTEKIDKSVALVLSNSKGFTENKKGQTKYFLSLSNLVVMDGIEPPTHRFSVYCSTD